MKNEEAVDYAKRCIEVCKFLNTGDGPEAHFFSRRQSLRLKSVLRKSLLFTWKNTRQILDALIADADLFHKSTEDIAVVLFISTVIFAGKRWIGVNERCRSDHYLPILTA